MINKKQNEPEVSATVTFNGVTEFVNLKNSKNPFPKDHYWGENEFIRELQKRGLQAD